jgi:3',5'-cyclic AMP phosphodiesterase CpdA
MRHLIGRVLLVPAWAVLALAPPAAAAHDDDAPHAHAHTHAEARPVAEADAHRPSGLPDRIILTFAGDPARTQAVTWRTSAAGVKAIAQIARADAAPDFVRNARTIDATTETLESDLGAAEYHSAVFDDLDPRTLYAYRVGDGVNWSEWVQFRTASVEPEPFSFLYFGDAQNDLKSMWSRVIREAYTESSRSRFIIHAGDLINRANRDAEWGEWFGAGGWVNAMVPSIPTPGNHEYEKALEGSGLKSRVSRHWRPQFALPTHGPEGLEETAYYIDYQGVRIVALNSNEKQEEQAEWLRAVLKDNPNRWTVLTFHHPIYSLAKERDNAELRRLWQPIFDEFRVDLVLTGHDHTYGRSGLVGGSSANVPTGARVADGGTVYVVSVSGPKMYELNSGEEWTMRKAENTQLFQVITIDGPTLTFVARTATGELYDAFELRKRPGQVNEMIEKVPASPERLRPKKKAAAAAVLNPAPVAVPVAVPAGR